MPSITLELFLIFTKLKITCLKGKSNTSQAEKFVKSTKVIHFSAMIGCLFSRLSPSSLTSLEKDPLETAVFFTPNFELIPIPASVNAFATPLSPKPLSGLADVCNEWFGAMLEFSSWSCFSFLLSCFWPFL